MASYINNYYKTFSGTDTIAFIILPGYKPVALGSVTTISYSMYRTKKPVMTIGRTNISGVTRGPRLYGGTMVFTVINQHWIANLAEQIDWLQKYNDLKCDELPIFDIMITSANEYGSYVNMYISGVDFTDEQQTMSVEDLFTENVFQFIARDIFTYRAGKVIVDEPDIAIGRKYKNGFYITDSSEMTNAELNEAYDELIKKERESQSKTIFPPLIRELYYTAY